MAVDTDVVIAGAGPVGLALAVLLGRRGVRTLIVESRPQVTNRDESRAITWMPEGLLAADAMGVTDRLRARAVTRRYHEFRDRPRGPALVTLDMGRLDPPHRHTLNLPQGDTEEVLESAALATGSVTLQRGWRVTDASDTGAGVEVRAEDAQGRTQDISARFGAGCDGAASTRRGVARMLGLSSDFRDYGANSVVADIEVSADPAPTDRSWIALASERPMGAFCFGDRRWRLVYRVNADETRDVVTSPDFVTSQLARAYPDAVVLRQLWASVFRLGQGQTRAYSRGRWALAGDAAHAMGPSAGAGMQLGILGAWRLSSHLHGAVLDDASWPRRAADYETGQRHAAVMVQRSNARIFRSMAITSRTASRVRSAVLRGAGRVPPVVVRMTKDAALFGLAPDGQRGEPG